MPSLKSDIGFIGLGIMGKPMAHNLLQAGFTLVVHDIDQRVLPDFVANGAQKVNTPKELAERVNYIITMLPDSNAVNEVVLGPKGLREGMSKGQIYIDMSTIASMVAVRISSTLNEIGVKSLDAPVSGGEVGAIEASLSIMVGGDQNTFSQALPILNSLGSNIVLCGPNGTGQIVKACNQIQGALNLLGMAEAIILASSAGVDPRVVLKVLSGGAAQSRYADIKGPRVIQGNFSPGFKAKYYSKDLAIALQTARDLRVPLIGTPLIDAILIAMLANGKEDLDASGIVSILENLANTKIRTNL